MRPESSRKLIPPVPLLGSVDLIVELARERSPRPLMPWVVEYVSETGIRGARDDLQLVMMKMTRLRDRPETFRAYRRDIESFLHWSWQLAGKRITQITRDDIQGFVAYLKSPPKSWVGPAQVDRHVVRAGTGVQPHPNWRLFVARESKSSIKRKMLGLSTASNPSASRTQHSSKSAIRSALSAVSWLYWSLIGDGLLKSNPAAALMKDDKNKLKADKGAYERILTEPQWKAVLATTRDLAEANPAHERTLFIVALLYLLKLRISEISGNEATMGRFRKRGDVWVYRVESGKRGKSRDVPCPNTMLQALRRYRKHLGLSPSLPGQHDSNPLLPKVSGRGSLGNREISGLLQLCFDTAARRLVEKKQVDDAFAIVSASAHWLRHTSATSEAHNGRPLVDLQHDLGHESLGTTSRYVHDDLRKRSASVRAKRF